MTLRKQNQAIVICVVAGLLLAIASATGKVNADTILLEDIKSRQFYLVTSSTKITIQKIDVYKFGNIPIDPPPPPTENPFPKTSTNAHNLTVDLINKTAIKKETKEDFLKALVIGYKTIFSNLDNIADNRFNGQAIANAQKQYNEFVTQAFSDVEHKFVVNSLSTLKSSLNDKGLLSSKAQYLVVWGEIVQGLDYSITKIPGSSTISTDIQAGNFGKFLEFLMKILQLLRDLGILDFATVNLEILE